MGRDNAIPLRQDEIERQMALFSELVRHDEDDAQLAACDRQLLECTTARSLLSYDLGCAKLKRFVTRTWELKHEALEIDEEIEALKLVRKRVKARIKRRERDIKKGASCASG